MEVPGVTNVLAFGTAGLVVLVYIKQYRIFTVIEYALLCMMIYWGSKISFSIFQTLKAVTSLLFFLLHYWTTTFEDLGKPIQYFIGSIKNPCHTMVAIDQKVYHYHLPASRGATTHERSSYLVAGKYSKTATEVKKSSFWAPCVGFAIHDDDKQIIKDLELCGKCQDWSIVAVYLLSRDKYLSYCAVSYLRWLNWGCLAINVGTYFMYWAATTIFQEDRDFNITNFFLSMFYVVSELTHMAIVALDKFNLIRSRIEYNDKKSDRRTGTQVYKIAVLFGFLIAYNRFGFDSMKYLGYLVYFVTCIIVGLVVNWLLSPTKWPGRWLGTFEDQMGSEIDDKTNELIY